MLDRYVWRKRTARLAQYREEQIPAASEATPARALRDHMSWAPGTIVVILIFDVRVWWLYGIFARVIMR
nr:hypothetical protein [uncultured Acidocella sp.]